MIVEEITEEKTCHYCGGKCPNEPDNSDFLCDGFAIAIFCAMVLLGTLTDSMQMNYNDRG